MNKRNAPTKKVSAVEFDEQFEITSLHGKTGSATGCIASMSRDVDGNTYSISWHIGEMPAYATEAYTSLQELANAMREIGDLRKWQIVKYE